MHRYGEEWICIILAFSTFYAKQIHRPEAEFYANNLGCTASDLRGGGETVGGGGGI